MSTTQPVQPIQQSPVEDLKNCLQIASAWAEGQPPLTAQTFVRIGQLIRHALEQLSEPNVEAVRLMGQFGRIPEYRDARDAAAVVLRAQLTGYAS